MARISRRSFIESAIAIGATAAWRFATPKSTKIRWTEQREFFPEGVASGDPDSSSVLLWTRHTPGTQQVTAEVAEDPAFAQVIATANAPISATSDWTCRVLIGGLRPSTVYWYRFTDPEGHGSRVGRTITAPDVHDSSPVRFAFVSCQNANQGAQNAYRRMIFEDERAPRQEQLQFVLHLGDFISAAGGRHARNSFRRARAGQRTR